MIDHIFAGKAALAQIFAPGVLGIVAYFTSHNPVFATILDEKTSVGIGLLVIFGGAAAVSIKAIFKFLMTMHDYSKVIKDTEARVDRIEIKLGIKEK